MDATLGQLHGQEGGLRPPTLRENLGIRLLGLGMAATAVLGACAGDSDHTDTATAGEPAEATSDNAETTVDPSTTVEVEPDLKDVEPGSLCEVMPSVANSEKLQQILGLQPGEKVIRDECIDYDDVTETRGQLADRFFEIGNRSLLDTSGNPMPLVGFSVGITHRTTLEEISNQEMGGPNNPPFGSLELEAASSDAVLFSYEDVAGHSYEAAGSERWVRIDVGDYQVYVGYSNVHPDAEAKIASNPVSVNGEVTPAWSEIANGVIRGVFFGERTSSATTEKPTETTTTTPTENETAALPEGLPEDLAPGEQWLDVNTGLVWTGQEGGPPINTGYAE